MDQLIFLCVWNKKAINFKRKKIDDFYNVQLQNELFLPAASGPNEEKLS